MCLDFLLFHCFKFGFTFESIKELGGVSKFKRTKEETYITLENRKKIATNSPRNVLKKKNKVEERGASSLGLKRE